MRFEHLSFAYWPCMEGTSFVKVPGDGRIISVITPLKMLRASRRESLETDCKRYMFQKLERSMYLLLLILLQWQTPAKALEGREGVSWLMTWGYGPSWWGGCDNRRLRRLVTVLPHSRSRMGKPACRSLSPLCLTQDPGPWNGATHI